MKGFKTINFSQNKRMYLFVLSFFIILGVLSIFKVINFAIINTVDFQLSSSRLFIIGENPYLYFLNGNLESKILSPPNYLHHLYALMSPLTLFGDKTARILWAFISIILAFWCSSQLCKLVKKPKLNLIVFLFFLISTPFMIGVSNSQNQILVLTFFILSMDTLDSKKIGFFGAFSFFKYSFSGSWIGMNIFRNFKAVLLSFVFTTIFIIIGAMWISSGNLKVDYLGPILVSSFSVSPGHADILTILDHFNFIDAKLRIFLGIILLLLNVLTVAWLVNKSKDILYLLSVGGVTSLMFLTHLIYDFVFLFPAFVFLLNKGGKKSLIGIIAILYFWQIERILVVLNVVDSSVGWQVFNLMLLTVLLISLVFSNKEKEQPFIVI